MMYSVRLKYWTKDHGEYDELLNEIHYDNKEEAYKFIVNQYRDEFEKMFEVNTEDGMKYYVLVDNLLFKGFIPDNKYLLWGRPNTHWHYIKEVE